MAVKLETTIHRWNCISSDAFPSSGVPEGSTMHVVDEGKEYIYHNGAWEQDKRRIYALSVT